MQKSPEERIKDLLDYHGIQAENINVVEEKNRIQFTADCVGKGVFSEDCLDHYVRFTYNEDKIEGYAIFHFDNECKDNGMCNEISFLANQLKTETLYRFDEYDDYILDEITEKIDQIMNLIYDVRSIL